MKHIYILSSLLLLLTACAHTRKTQTSPVSFQGATAIDQRGDLLLLGEHPRTDLQRLPFATWFDRNYAAYTVDTNTANLLTPLLANHTFKIFMGTWCGDSQREVPRMLKILDDCHVPSNHIHIIMLDYRDSVYKQSPGHEEKGEDIHHVPDLIVMDESGENGRIIESPVVSLEKDLLVISRSAPYEPDYWLSAQFRTYPMDTLEKQFDALADTLKAKTEGEGELASYGRILLGEGDTAHAIFTCRLNTAVYPKSAFVNSFMGYILLKVQDPMGARKAFEKALALDPADKRAGDYMAKHPD